MKLTPKIEKLIEKATPLGNTWNSVHIRYTMLMRKAEVLVKERISGERKGLPGEPAYMHSFRVYQDVNRLHHWDDPDLELFLAALLHDIVEDGGVSFEELVDIGFPGKTIRLIYLCTHDKTIKNHTERWMLMIAGLVEARNDDAWTIKLADLTDNLKQSEGLSQEDRKFMVEVKAPILLRLTEDFDNWTRRWRNELRDEMLKQRDVISREDKIKT